MKRCFKCNEMLPLSEFYRHSEMADGHVNKCKTCAKLDVRSNYRKTRDDKRAYDRKRTRTPERRAKQVEYVRQKRARCPEKYKAWNAVSGAIRAGKLVREPCEVCGGREVEAHHEDYAKPLDVRWFCRTHHRMHHGTLTI